jgi:4-hydroxybenzoyl-CoA thioesterase/acyl-CoA thioester hydrolase
MLALIQMPEGRPIRLPADWPERYAHLFKRGDRAAR